LLETALGIRLGGAHDVGPSALGLEGLLAARVPALCHDGRDEPVLCGAARVERLGVRAKHLPQPDDLRGGQADGMARLRHRKPQQLGDGDGGADGTRGRGDVPPHVVVLRPHGEPDLALGLDAGHQGDEEVGAVKGTLPLGDGEEGAGDGAGRVDDGVEVGVVVVVDVGGYAVEESRVVGVEVVGWRVADEGGGGGAEEGLEGSELREPKGVCVSTLCINGK
jgi:hypothetical protein